MKKISILLLSALLSASSMAQTKLSFDASSGIRSSLVMHNGKTVGYTAYEKLYYVTNIA